MATRTKEWIITESGNRINRKVKLKDTQSIVLGGKTTLHHGVTLNSDCKSKTNPTAAITVGRYTHIQQSCTITPAYRNNDYVPSKIGDYVQFGEGSSSQALQIASCVIVGRNCDLQNCCIVRDAVIVDDGTVIAPYTVIPPYSRVSGVPGRVVEELPESLTDSIRDRMRATYSSMIL